MSSNDNLKENFIKLNILCMMNIIKVMNLDEVTFPRRKVVVDKCFYP